MNFFRKAGNGCLFTCPFTGMRHATAVGANIQFNIEEVHMMMRFFNFLVITTLISLSLAAHGGDKDKLIESRTGTMPLDGKQVSFTLNVYNPSQQAGAILGMLMSSAYGELTIGGKTLSLIRFGNDDFNYFFGTIETAEGKKSISIMTKEHYEKMPRSPGTYKISEGDLSAGNLIVSIGVSGEEGSPKNTFVVNSQVNEPPKLIESREGSFVIDGNVADFRLDVYRPGQQA